MPEKTLACPCCKISSLTSKPAWESAYENNASILQFGYKADFGKKIPAYRKPHRKVFDTLSTKEHRSCQPV